MAGLDTNEQRVLVLAPTGRDASLIGEALRGAGIEAELCRSLEEFAGKLDACAAGLVAEEALDPGSAPILAGTLRDQPAWSDIPIVLMTNRQGPGEALSGLWKDGFNITLLERPVRIQTLISAVHSALRQRRRQYDLRNHLAEQQQTEERLRRTQKLESLGVLAGGVAHDFNNLLTGIIGNASLALDSVPAENPARELLNDALQASQRAADLTRQLLAYSGKGRFVIEPIDLSDLVRQITILVQTSISKNVKLKLDLAERLPCMIGDASQVQQVIMNLVINAAEAIDQDQSGAVLVKTGLQQVDTSDIQSALVADHLLPGEYVYLEVQDTGCGIDPAMLPKVFDPFFTTKFVGRGLGLAAVQGIVRGHKGMLSVDSTPGDGSTFKVFFPVAEREPASPKVQAERGDLTGAGTILVVEDEEIVRRIARNALESYGYAVLVAENGQAALKLFRRAADQISAVLLDMTMPVMGGEETLRNLQRIRPGVKVILTSGYNEVDVIRRFEGMHLAGFLQKPYTAEQLARKIKATFDRDPVMRSSS